MGWEIRWYTDTQEFQEASDTTEWFKLQVFVRDGERVYLTYETRGRGVEPLGPVGSFLDLTPLGRQEDWEDTPPGRPRGPRYEWWRLHDEYERGSGEPGTVIRRTRLHSRACRRLWFAPVLGGRNAPVTALVALGVALTVVPAAEANRNLYVTGGGDANIAAFDIAPGGALTPVAGSPFATGSAPEGVALSPDGKHLYVAVLGDDAVAAFDVGASGALTPVAGSPFGTGAGTAPAGIAVTPDGAHLYAALVLGNGVAGFDIGADGALTPMTGSPFASGGLFPTGVTVTPDGAHLFVVNRDSDAIASFAISPAGVPSFLASFPVGGPDPRFATLTPDGSHLYTTTADPDNAVRAFDVGADGSLAQLPGSPFPTGGTFPIRTQSVTPDGRHLYAANAGTNNLSGFEIDGAGVLTALTGSPYATGPSPTSTSVTPDGRNIYVANQMANSISAFELGPDGVPSAVPGSPFPATVLTPDLQALAVTPNQGPTAAFAATAGTAGAHEARAAAATATTFNAAASSDPDGTVARFDWNFGDGTTLADGGPTPTHTYATAGTYTVSLIVTDNEGCSDELLFTGQTAYCNGSNAAVATQQVIVADATAPILVLRGRRVQRGARSITLRATCDEACTAVARGRLVVTTPAGAGHRAHRGARATLPIKRRTKALAANVTTRLKLRLSPRARSAVHEALAAGGSAVGRIVVRARDTAGNATQKRRRVLLR